ncbi:MAG: lysophospholipid acyltransferase family protein [Bryobacter sp.]|nr:lysophospholipid acyltransferase family protein [Bryobacter sp.]
MHSPHGPLRGIFAQALPPGFPQPVFSALAKILKLEEADALYYELKRRGPAEEFVKRLLEHLQVRIHASEEDLARIPKKGPVIALANHPFGLFDGAFLAEFLPKVRPDVKVLANSMLLNMPELEGRIIPVDPFGNPESRKANIRGMLEALRWLAQGGMLVVFPAGEVSSLRLGFPHIGIEDPEWSETVARMLRQSKATAIPLYIEGRNSMLFQVAGLINPRLRTALLPSELLNKRRAKLTLRCGSPIPAEKIEKFASDAELISHLRWRTYLLGRRRARRLRSFHLGRPVAPGAPAEALAAELARTQSGEPAVRFGEYDVFLRHGSEMGILLDEIGRLRELTFRTVGEGSGRSRDLDRFDLHYHHVILWNREKQEIVGAYRLGLVNEILPAHGLKGLYTSTLFRFHQGFFEALGPAVELGRSFIRQDYQKSFQPLLLLWKGIGRFLLDHPPAHVLFGPVSISANYSNVSRELMAAVLSRMTRGESLARLVSPKNPLRQKLEVSPACDPEELESMIAELESDAKPLPVLLRQYLKLGAQLHAFNVDPKFQNCLDGLVVVDLFRSERKMLERYMGAEGAKTFLDQNRKGVPGGDPSGALGSAASLHRPI